VRTLFWLLLLLTLSGVVFYLLIGLTHN